MLKEFFDSAARVDTLRMGPAGPLVQSFGQALFQAGYADTARRHLRAAEHFAYWADRRGTLVHDLDEQVLTQFARHLPRCRCVHYGRSDEGLLRGARLFLRHLEATGIVKIAAPPSSSPDSAVLTSFFCQWMRSQRGTCETTLSAYRPHIRELLSPAWREHGGLGCLRFAAVRHRRQAAVRMGSGQEANDGVADVPSVSDRGRGVRPGTPRSRARPRPLAACLPAALPPARGGRTPHRSCDLGLTHRPGVIGRSCCSWPGWAYGPATSFNFDCRTSTGGTAGLRVCGKGGREARLPLPQDVGQALAAYLIDGRPRIDADALFVAVVLQSAASPLVLSR